MAQPYISHLGQHAWWNQSSGRLCESSVGPQTGQQCSLSHQDLPSLPTLLLQAATSSSLYCNWHKLSHTRTKSPVAWKSYVCALMAWVGWQNKSDFPLWLFKLYLHQKLLFQMWLVLHKPMDKYWLVLKKKGKFRNRDFPGNWTFFCLLNTPAQCEVSATLQRLSSLAWLDPT